jgi:hypothetical protein
MTQKQVSNDFDDLAMHHLPRVLSANMDLIAFIIGFTCLVLAFMFYLQASLSQGIDPLLLIAGLSVLSFIIITNLR